MTRIKEFLAANRLRQVDVAEYLGVSRAYMSQVVSGWARLAPDKLLQLIENNKGWDTSMFDKAEEPQSTTQEVFILRDRIRYLERILAEKERLINVLLDKANLSPGCPPEKDKETQNTEI